MAPKRTQTAIPVVVLRTATGYNAFSPAVDGCVVTAKTIDSAMKRIKEALAFHLEGERILRKSRKLVQATLRESFDDYGTDAFYASVEVGLT
jgi:predicted RNase H-like HicB family nuclease